LIWEGKMSNLLEAIARIHNLKSLAIEDFLNDIVYQEVLS